MAGWYLVEPMTRRRGRNADTRRFVAAPSRRPLLLAPAAARPDYPPPRTRARAEQARGEGRHDLKVCKQRLSLPRRSRTPIDAAKAGDTIKVANGTYREGVQITRPPKTASS